MGDYAIRMHFDIAAEPDTVRRALTERDGIAGWWSTRVEGDPGSAGGRLGVWFPDLEEPFEFTVDPGQSIDWTVGGRPEPWQGTTVSWRVAPGAGDGSTALGFRHHGFDAANPVIEIVTPAWALIIDRLRRFAETGAPNPFFVL